MLIGITNIQGHIVATYKVILLNRGEEHSLQTFLCNAGNNSYNA